MENKKLYENLLKADGIDPENITDSERNSFRQLLEQENKRFRYLSWISVGSLWVFVLALTALIFSEPILDKFNIPFLAAFFAVIAGWWVLYFVFLPKHNKKVKETGRKVQWLYFLVNGKRKKGITLAARADGKRVINWFNVMMVFIVVWLVVFFGGAVVFYLLSKRWFPSSAPVFHILYSTLAAIAFIFAGIRNGFKTPLNQLVETKQKHFSPDIHWQNIWRFIMKSRIAKLSVVLLILITIGVFISIMEKTTSVAYAIEKSIQAYNSIRYLYAKEIRPNQEEPLEFWIKSDKFGNIEKARYYLPAYLSPADGAKMITWTPEKAELYFKKKNSYLVFQSNRIEDMMKDILQRSQPKLVMEKLLADEKAGLIEISKVVPKQKNQPISMMVQNKNKPVKTIYYINQATNLITVVEYYEIKDGKEKLISTQEYYDYNVPIDDKIFTIADEVPKDVTKVDWLNQVIGIAQGDMSYEEAAVETVKQFFQALADKNYKKAGLIFSGISEERAKEYFGKLNVIRVISVDRAVPYPKCGEHSFSVSCEIELGLPDGSSKVREFPAVKARCGDDEMHPDRWIIHGGI